MAEPPEFWTFIASNLLLLIIGTSLSGLSYQAYRRTPDRPSLGSAALGFALVTLGALVEAVYELGIRGSYQLGGRELLALHTVEGVTIAAGLAVIYYSLKQY